MFKVITSYEEAQALGQAGLLWWSSASRGFVPSTTEPAAWARTDDTLRAMVEDGEYAILLEA